MLLLVYNYILIIIWMKIYKVFKKIIKYLIIINSLFFADINKYLYFEADNQYIGQY